MSWTVTIEVVDSVSPSTTLENAKIEKGPVLLGFTNASGQYLATLVDSDITPILIISLDPTYVRQNLGLRKQTDSGSVKTVALVNPPTIPDGHDPNIGGESGGDDGGGCFIVTAATGSAESEEVTGLRQLRERVRATSSLGGQLIEAIYDEYAQFSPKIADELELDTVSRMAVLQIVVKPLFAWYTLAGKLALDQADQQTVSQGVQALLDACPQYLGNTILTQLEAIRAGEALPADAPAQLVELAPRIAHLPFASWAILDPLIRACRSVKDNLDVVDEVAQWLATAPLESLSRPNDPKQLELEFGKLTSFFNFKPTARPQLGERLLTAWPEAAVSLEHTGFISNKKKYQ